MPSTYISLENVFTNSQYAMNDAYQRQILLESLKLGKIKSFSAKSIKASLRHIYTEKSLAEAVTRLPISANEKAQALSDLEAQIGPIYYVWAEGYYTIQLQDRAYHVLGYLHIGDPIRQVEIDESFWKNAWIDEIRWSVICKEPIDWTLYEFMHVGFLRSDVEDIFQRKLKQQRGRPGAKRKLFQETQALAYGEELLARWPNMSRTEWETKVREKIKGIQPERTMFHILYGPVWTGRRQIRKSKN